MKPTILAIDNDQLVLGSLKELFLDADIEIEAANNGELGIALFKEHPKRFALVMLDFEMKTKDGQGMDGDEVAGEIKGIDPDARIVMVSCVDDERIVELCLKAGAEKFIRKDSDASHLLSTISSMVTSEAETERSETDLERSNRIRKVLKMVGRSRELGQVADLISKFAVYDEPILILGESGVGKEGVAKAIHENSGRKAGSFVAINCAALGKDVLESELFGHEQGSFTGAHRKKVGLFEQAHGGTIFLDEIGDMPMDLQVKILRALQEKMVRPVGGLPRKVDFRVVAATHRDLKSAVEEGSFRQDLYYRLKYLAIEVAPLRERPEDIEPLVYHFLSQMEERTGVSKKISDTALRKLKSYWWPGNVRNLEAIVKKAFVLSEDRITPRVLQNELVGSPSSHIDLLLERGGIMRYEDFIRRGEDQERQLLTHAMELSGNVKSAAAALLGMNHNTMNYRRSVLGIEEKKPLTSRAVAD